ncbi:MAG: hypothetical protein ACR2IE_17190 [Candidatus Sumerlaeaceae bacterium]
MATAEVEVAKLSAGFLQSASQAETLCETLEKGQDAALSKLFKTIQESYSAGFLPVLALPLSSGVLEPAAKWLLGEDTTPLLKGCLEKFDVVEIKFSKAGFSLQHGGEAIEALTATELLERMRTSSCDEANRKELPILTLPANAALVDVAVYLPRDLSVLREQSSIMLRLLSRCSFAVFTAGSSYTVTESDSAFLAEVLPSFEAIAPIVIEEEQEMPALPWWRAGSLPGNPVMLPEIILPRPQPPVVNEEGVLQEPPSPPTIPDVLTNPANACRQTLQVITHARKLGSAVEAAGPRCETELKKLLTTQIPLAQKDKELEAQAKSKDTKAELDAIKNLLDEELGDIQAFVEDTNLRLTQRRGKFVTGVRDLVESVSEDDFEDIQGVKTIRKALTQDFVDRMLSVVSRDVREQLKSDCTEVTKRIKDLNDELDEILTRIRGSKAHLELPVPDEKIIWHFMKNEICITARCEVERPKKGLLTIIAAGRKMLMPIFMTLGMVGFGSVRKSMQQDRWQMILLVVGACTYAYFEAKSEQQEKFEKELEKIKDTLSNETGKIINDVQKEKVSRIITYLNMIKKSTLKRVDEQVKLFTDARVQVMDREKANVKNKLKSLDTRIKELQDFTKQMEKLQTSARDLETNGRKLLVEAAKGPAPAAPGRPAAAPSSRVSATAAAAAPAAPRVSRVADAVAAAVPAAAVAAAEAAPAAAAAGASRIPEIVRPERPPREPRPERTPREPKEKKEEAPKESASSRMAALRASLKK